DVRKAIAVVIDVETVDGVGMERVGIRIGVEDEHGPCRIGGRLEGVEVAEVEPLVAERRAEAEAGKMIGHLSLLCSVKNQVRRRFCDKRLRRHWNLERL